MFEFSKKNKRGGIDHTKHNTITSMENIINSMSPPPQIVQMNQMMNTTVTPSPAAADSGSSSSAPTSALIPEVTELYGVPVIDLSCPDDALFARQFREAAQNGGCFQVINYAAIKDSVEKTSAGEGKEACKLESLPAGYYKDFRSLRCRSLDVASKMFKVILESIGLAVHDYSVWMVQGDDQGQHVAMSYYYPPWTDYPGLSRGPLQEGHCDPNAFTIHLLDQESAAGMQIFRRGQWIDVEPHPGALLVTIGDKIEALSKGKYKSARYRMTVSPDKERISLPLGSLCCRTTAGSTTGKSPAICI